MKYLSITLLMFCVAVANAQNIKVYKSGLFRFKVYSRPISDHYCTIDSIVVLNSSTKALQTIRVLENSADCASGAGLLLGDWNFDGIQDICVVAGSSGANIDSYHWLYDKTRGKFVHDSQLDAASPSSYDRKYKTMLSYYREDAGTHYEYTYKWFGKKLRMIKSVKKISTDDEYVTVITQKLLDDKLKIVSRKRYKKSEIDY